MIRPAIPLTPVGSVSVHLPPDERLPEVLRHSSLCPPPTRPAPRQLQNDSQRLYSSIVLPAGSTQKATSRRQPFRFRPTSRTAPRSCWRSPPGGGRPAHPAVPRRRLGRRHLLHDQLLHPWPWSPSAPPAILQPAPHSHRAAALAGYLRGAAWPCSWGGSSWARCCTSNRWCWISIPMTSFPTYPDLVFDMACYVLYAHGAARRDGGLAPLPLALCG